MNFIINTLHRLYALLFIPIYYSVLELLHLTKQNGKAIFKTISVGIVLFVTTSSLGYQRLTLWCLKWVILGVMSSIGFGFGMHTFVLFLAPHIAAVTLAADSCKSLNFPDPPYPDSIICPYLVSGEQVTFLDILRKVALESFMWGLGTAIGELPPYLGARVRGQAITRTAGGDSQGPNSQAAGWELWMIRIINKIGFTGILLCAAIPNPLFDAAGVASGYAQVPFLSFFGATFIGKAIIKVLIQTSFVILIFHSNHLDTMIIGLDKRLKEFHPLTKNFDLHGFLDEKRKNFMAGKVDEPGQSVFSLGTVISMVPTLLMILFGIGFINALSQQYKDRTAKTKSS